MAGSYKHVTNEDGGSAGVGSLENMGDVHEAVEEMHAIIRYFARRLASDGPYDDEADAIDNALYWVNKARAAASPRT